MFVAGLQSPHISDELTRLLPKLEQNKDVTVKAFTTECQRLMNLIKNSYIRAKKTVKIISKKYLILHVGRLTRPYTLSCLFKKYQLCHKCGHVFAGIRSQTIKKEKKNQKLFLNSVREKNQEMSYQK